MKCNGKGITKEVAEASAHAEVIERISALEAGLDFPPIQFLFYDGLTLLQRVRSFCHVPGYRWTHEDCIQNAVGVEALLRNIPFSKPDFSTLKDKSRLLRDWIPSVSLISDREYYVPPMFIRWISATNGLASGNTIEEAMIHGFCEVIERWATIFVLRQRIIDIPTIDLNTVNDPSITEIISFFEENEIEVVVKDLSFEQGIPAYGLLTFDKTLDSRFLGYNTLKVGCHFDAKEALRRAFTERVQGTDFTIDRRLGYINRDDQEIFLPLFFKGVCPLNLEKLKSGPVVPFRNYTYDETDQAISEMKRIADLLKTDLLVVNHTHPVLNFPSVRIVMPGISDFIGWWHPNKVSVKFIGNLDEEKWKYEESLSRFLKSFFVGGDHV